MAPALPASRFARPAGTPAAIVAALDAAGLGLARARVAARLGNPDPFAVRAALGALALVGDTIPLPEAEGAPVTPEVADAALVAAAVALGRPEPALTGLFAGRPPGPAVRAVPVDDARFTALRFPRGEPPPPALIGATESWSVAELGDVAVATVRCIVEVPGGVALGSDYGLTIWKNGRFTPFPWPAGCRREARRVEAMALDRGALWVATSQALVRWDFRGEPTIRKHGADEEEGWDELRCLLAGPNGLLRGYRTRFDGGDAPPDVFALVEVPGGAVYAGTGAGELHVVDACGPLRSFASGPHQPVRHLAFADGALHVAAGGRHHRFDGASWSSTAPEPTAFSVDRRGRLWSLLDGKVTVATREGTKVVPAPVERPWSLCAAGDRLWIGGRERVAALTIRGG